MKWPEIWKKKKQTPVTPSPAAMESSLRRGITIISSELTPGGILLHKGVVQPGATIFSRAPRPDKDA